MKYVFVFLLLSGIHSIIQAQNEPEIVWARQMGTQSEEFGKCVGTDSENNLYLAGETNDSLAENYSGGTDLFVYKYDAEGNQLWQLRFGSANDDRLNVMKVDTNGECYLVGDTKGSFENNTAAGEKDAFVAKISANGNIVWVKQIGSVKNESANNIDIDESGNSYVVGSTDGNLAGEGNISSDVFITKLDNRGQVLWIRQHLSDTPQTGSGIYVDRINEVYICGTVNGIPYQDEGKNIDAFYSKLDSTGNALWIKIFGATAQFDAPAVITGDTSGNIFIGGSTGGDFAGDQSGKGDAFLVKFNKKGEEVWKRQFGRENWDGILAMTLTHKNYGDILVGGCQNWPACEGYCRSYTTDGDLLWKKEFITQGEFGGTCGKDVTIDSEGNIYHTGGTGGDLFQKASGEHDIYVVKLSDKSD
ncbi:MAG: SBBP repeat-containing protein [Bacteroidales bacterium]|nr:SBBP repeat-containing protein [Bacteroidales bacterium]